MEARKLTALVVVGVAAASAAVAARLAPHPFLSKSGIAAATTAHRAPGSDVNRMRPHPLLVRSGPDA